MQVEVKHATVGRTIFTFDKNGTCYVEPSPSNCRLCYLDNVRGIPLKKEYWDYVLTRCQNLVYVHTTDEKIYHFIRENYELYIDEVLPVGQGNYNQYHMLIRNMIGGYSRGTNKPKPVKKSNNTKSKDQIRHDLVELLRSKKRKTDIVEDIMKLI